MNCPACSLTLESPAATCPRCRADLSLLKDFTSDVRTLLDKADRLRCDGQLAPAVHAYLEVLETDPANPQARAALGPVLRALRSPRASRADVLILLTGAAIATAGFAAGYWWAH